MIHFNGVQLSALYFNGIKCDEVFINGVSSYVSFGATWSGNSITPSVNRGIQVSGNLFRGYSDGVPNSDWAAAEADGTFSGNSDNALVPASYVINTSGNTILVGHNYDPQYGTTPVWATTVVTFGIGTGFTGSSYAHGIDHGYGWSGSLMESSGGLIRAGAYYYSSYAGVNYEYAGYISLT